MELKKLIVLNTGTMELKGNSGIKKELIFLIPFNSTLVAGGVLNMMTSLAH